MFQVLSETYIGHFNLVYLSHRCNVILPAHISSTAVFPPQQYWWIAQPGTTISPPQWAIPLQGRLSATWIISCHGWKIILDHWTIAVKPHHIFDKNSLKEKYCIYYSFMKTLWHENAFHITCPFVKGICSWLEDWIKTEFWCVLWCKPEQAFRQTMELLVILDAMPPMRFSCNIFFSMLGKHLGDLELL